MNLISPSGTDYSNLEKLLVSQDWMAADIETKMLMIKIGNREAEGWLDTEQINDFPCAELKIIDGLWRKYSGDRFGFTMQKKVWENVGGMVGKLDNSSIYLKFCDRVGWRFAGDWVNYDELTFDIKAPIGHLPFQGFMSFYGGMSVLFSRLYICRI
jgi:eukaryotic-like serine/threonine-protein kinase